MSMQRHPAFAVRRRATAAFTLLELLVVVAIIAVMAAAGVPAIRNIIYTSTSSLAESQLKLAINGARDLAIRNSSGDTGLVFTFEPGGRINLVTVIYVGKLLDDQNPGAAPGAGNPKVYREVFVPTPLADPVQLPPGWMVRGFATPGSIFDPNMAVFNRDVNGQAVVANGWYFDSQSAPRVGNRYMNMWDDQIIGLPNRGNWVFPETGFFDPTQAFEGDLRQTFMVRFQSGTGKVVLPNTVPAVVLLPRDRIDTSKNPQALPTNIGLTQFDWRRVDRADNLPNWARSVLGLPNAEAVALIGTRSTDCATVQPVSLLALYEESRMAFAIGATGVDRVTGTIYGTTPTLNAAVGAAGEAPKAPNINLDLWRTGTTVQAPVASGKAERTQMLINAYIIGALKSHDVFTAVPKTVPGIAVESDVRIFSFESNRGGATEAKP